MTSGSHRAQPWWQAQLTWLGPQLARYAVRRAKPSEAEDLAQDVLTVLVRTLGRNEAALPAAWLASTPPENEKAERARLWTYARTILRRRIADRYRREAARWRYEIPAGVDADMAPSGEPLVIDEIIRRELLAACVEALGKLPHDELEALRLAVDGFGLDRAMTPAERKRLSRARHRISASILARLRDRFGSGVDELFDEELRS